MPKYNRSNLFIDLFTLIVCIVVFFPIYWMIYSALLPTKALYRWPPTTFPDHLNIEALVTIFTERPLLRWISNTVIVSILTVAGSIPPSVLAAYAFYKFNFKGKKLLFRLLFLIMLTPAAVVIIPLYMMLSSLHLTNSLLGLALLYSVFRLPGNIIIFYSYLFSIPPEIEESALVDGCTRIGAFIRIILPVSVVGIAAIAVLSFTLGWNEFMFAITMLSDAQQWTAVCGIYSFIGQWTLSWDKALISATYFSIPALVFYFFSQKYFVSGMTAGAIKGV